MKFGNGDGSITKVKEKRRKPFRVRVTTGFRINEKTHKKVAIRKNIGYYATQEEALRALLDYQKNGVCLEYITFKQIFEKWKKEYFPSIAKSAQYNYEHTFKLCEQLHELFIVDININQLQMIINGCEQGYPTMKVTKTLLNKLFEYAVIYNYLNQNYIPYVYLSKQRRKHYLKIEPKKIFTKKEVERIWHRVVNKYDAIVDLIIIQNILGHKNNTYYDYSYTILDVNKSIYAINLI